MLISDEKKKKGDENRSIVGILTNFYMKFCTIHVFSKSPHL